MQHEPELNVGGLTPEMKARLKRVGVIALALALIVVAWGLFTRYRESRETNSWTQQQAIPAVSVISPHHGKAIRTLILPGNLQPYIDAPILARVDGYLLRWYHDIGAHVKSGELLAEIDTPELDHQLDQAKADLASAVANQQLAEVTAKRWLNLLTTDSVSKQDTDQKVADLAARKAAVDAARANVQRIEAFENFKRVVAPFNGVITARKTDVGALISAGSGTELFNVATLDPLRLYVPVPQYYTRQIQVGMLATLTVPEHPGMDFKAKLVRTSGSISGNSGTLLVELSVDNKQGLLTPGSYAEVKFELPQNASIQRVPASALILRTEGVHLALVQPDSHVKLKKVVVGRDFGSEVEVLSGLEPGDRIVDSPPDSLEDGDLVRVMASPAPKAAAEGKGK
ncbi:MAG: efflux RND transporter periplasmic adaptor subunit [Betaproteobacteria bacterium]|nr:efflux RND transporter periplasmic adaptor subunit [Betaproteobacteria bacterium]